MPQHSLLLYLLTIIEQNSLETIQFAIEWLQRQGLPIQNNQIVNYLVNLNSKPSDSKDLLEAPIEQACYHQLSEISSIYSQGENSWICVIISLEYVLKLGSSLFESQAMRNCPRLLF